MNNQKNSSSGIPGRRNVHFRDPSADKKNTAPTKHTPPTTQRPDARTGATSKNSAGGSINANTGNRTRSQRQDIRNSERERQQQELQRQRIEQQRKAYMRQQQENSYGNALNRRTYGNTVRQSSGASSITLDKRWILLAVIVVLVGLNIFSCIRINQRYIPEKETAEQIAKESKINLEKEQTDLPSVDTFNVTSADFANGELVLVNNDTPFKFDYKGTDITDEDLIRVNTRINDKSFKAADNTIYLNETVIEALNTMFADFCEATGKRDVMINSAHRSREQQQSILESKIKQYGADQKIAQKPGYSEHHTGYGFDISIYPDGGVGARTFTGDGEYGWIYENCHKYGFILRYPEGKTDVTGITPESWHFRYVGVPHSTYIYQRGITLEEYLAEVKVYKENVPMTIELSETESYSVYYVNSSDKRNTEYKVPKDTEYGISGDNIGGFVIWYNNADVGKKNEKTVETPEETELQHSSDNAQT